MHAYQTQFESQRRFKPLLVSAVGELAPRLLATPTQNSGIVFVAKPQCAAKDIVIDCRAFAVKPPTVRIQLQRIAIQRLIFADRDKVVHDPFAVGFSLGSYGRTTRHRALFESDKTGARNFS